MLERPLIIENVSAYARLPGELDETSFIRAVLDEADCQLLLDINNVYVNATNFSFDPLAYIQAMPGERIAYLHMAGHYAEPDGFLIDTHGAEIIDPVWDLLDVTYTLIGERAAVLPTCLERDFNFPPLADLLTELRRIRGMQQLHRSAPRLSA